MAKAYRALSRIQHGEEKNDGQGNIVNELIDIPVGATVTGLPDEVMANLWEAGVLEEFEDVKPTASTTITRSTPAQTTGTDDDTGATSDTGSTPDAPPAE